MDDGPASDSADGGERGAGAACPQRRSAAAEGGGDIPQPCLILDQGYYTTGYPELTVTGQRRGGLVAYAESLFDKGRWTKGNRGEVEGKEFKGYRDTFVPDGAAARKWRPLWWRTWRYIEA